MASRLSQEQIAELRSISPVRVARSQSFSLCHSQLMSALLRGMLLCELLDETFSNIHIKLIASATKVCPIISGMNDHCVISDPNIDHCGVGRGLRLSVSDKHSTCLMLMVVGRYLPVSWATP